MSLAISFFPYPQEFSQYLPHSDCSKNSQFCTSPFPQHPSEKWLSPLATKFWKLLGENFFPHCHLFHHRALLSGSSASDEKLLLGLKGFVFIGDNLTMKKF